MVLLRIGGGCDEVVLDVASTGLEGAEGAAEVAAERMFDIMRFWNSPYLLCRCSIGEALLAIPSVYASSASFRLFYEWVIKPRIGMRRSPSVSFQHSPILFVE